jgi:hypothetical protein
VLAPLLAHAALNDSALVAGRAAHRLSRRRTGPPARVMPEVRGAAGGPEPGKKGP